MYVAVTLSVPCGSDVVLRVAVHVAGVVGVPAVDGEQAAALPSKLVPLKNCTVLVMAGPLFAPEVTVAVSVTLLSTASDGALEMRAVVVA